MSVAAKIEEDLNAALKAGEREKLAVLRLLKNSFTAAAKEKKAELTDEDAIKVLQKEAKQRKDSIASYKQGGREDLAVKEQTELALIETYLPEQMGEDELNKIIEAAISESGASDMQDMGKVMGLVSKQTAGKADGAQVAALVKQKLSQS